MINCEQISDQYHNISDYFFASGGDPLACQVILPKLTYEMQSGRILEWLCAEGQTLSAGQPLFVVETDKATTEIPADDAGLLLKIVVPVGVDVPVGTTVAWVGAANEQVPESVPVVSGAGGSPLAPAASALPAELAQAPAASVTDAEVPDEIIATPVAKRMARDLGVDLKAVAKHTGKQRVREADIRAYVAATASAAAPTSLVPTVPAEVAPPVVMAPPAVVLSPGPETADYQLIQPTLLQKAMAARMTQAALVPQSAAGCEVELAGFEAFRASLQAGWEKKYGFRLSYTHLVAALMARAIQHHPLLNASWTEQGLRLYPSVDLGIAMASDRGLVVPVVRGAQEKSLGEVAQEIVRLQRASENNRLTLQDLQGGTVTLTNVGMLGIELSVPVVNPPQSAILGVGARRTKLVLQNGQVTAVPVMSVTLASDHRLVDGAVQGAFLQTFREYVNNPALALTV
jgi:pyruvate dehydrogenase E2 component (dihydrolipoamide acetyltransferase)